MYALGSESCFISHAWIMWMNNFSCALKDIVSYEVLNAERGIDALFIYQKCALKIVNICDK